jgi:hypothetical protein
LRCQSALKARIGIITVSSALSNILALIWIAFVFAPVAVMVIAMFVALAGGR